MLDLSGTWCWDFWLADADDGDHHLFFLSAPTSLGDPDLRHRNVRIGHAVSTDLTTWRRVGDALAPGERGTADDGATWTGSVVRHPDGGWIMFYTCGYQVESDVIQAVGCATSPDLYRWTKSSSNPILRGDDPRYEAHRPGTTANDFRDPWVFPDPGGDGWHMLITARSPDGPSDDRAVVGHAVSADLARWTLLAPLSTAGAGFSQFEVMQSVVVDGRPVLLFSCLTADLSAGRRASSPLAGTWVAYGESLTGPWDLAGAHPLTDESLYSGRVVRDPNAGRWSLMAFHNLGPDGEFRGTISDPMPLTWIANRLVVAVTPADPVP